MSTFTTTTREQDDFAAQLAESCESVEVRLLHDGVASVIRHGVAPGERVVFLIDEDGNEADTLARKDREAERLMDALDWQPGTGMSHDEVRALYATALRGWPQYDGKLDDAEVVVATRRESTKGGVACEAGDVLLVTERGAAWLGDHSVTAFCPRRVGFVCLPTYSVRAL